MVKIDTRHLTFKTSTTINSRFMVVVIVSKKIVKKAANRNLLKRRLREIFKNTPIKGVIYTKKGAGELSYQELRQESAEILKKLIK